MPGYTGRRVLDEQDTNWRPPAAPGLPGRSGAGISPFPPPDGGRLRYAPQGRRHRALRASTALHLDPLRYDGGLAAIGKGGRVVEVRVEFGLRPKNGFCRPGGRCLPRRRSVDGSGVAAGHCGQRTPNSAAYGRAGHCAGALTGRVSRLVNVRGEPLPVGPFPMILLLVASSFPCWNIFVRFARECDQGCARRS